jgi:shikimate dehydrogenase
METTSITKDTQLCMSLSGRPSNRGTRFHNYLYSELGLDFVYKAFTTRDLAGAIAGIRALGIRGCAVSMPFKQDAVALVDSLDDSVEAIGALNTIVNTDGRLRAYNTDYIAVTSLLNTHRVPQGSRFAVLGSGGMARAVLAALRDFGLQDGTVVSRNRTSGTALAQQYGLTWQEQVGAAGPSLLVNATPVGMAGGEAADALPVPPEVIDSADVVFDVVAVPPLTPLIREARAAGKHVITGDEVLTLQGVEQFVLYTGIRPDAELVQRAADFSRGN